MDAIATLMAEHRVIERVLAALEAHAGRIAAGEVTDRADLAEFARFLRWYADELHHGKEEQMLFARMAQHGFPTNAGPLAVMLADHDAGRALVTRLREIAARDGEWTAAERREANETALRFATLLRGHIQKEDRVLYPMAERHLPQEVMLNLADEFAQDAQLQGCHAAELERTADTLEARWVFRRPLPPDLDPRPRGDACGECPGC